MTRLPDREAVARAIAEAEDGTSARIHVVLLDHERLEDPLRRAREIFARLDLGGAAGVLVLVAPRARRFAVLGNDAVHDRVGDPLWQHVVAEMGELFAAGDVEGGIWRGLDVLGDALRRHHPQEMLPS